MINKSTIIYFVLIAVLAVLIIAVIIFPVANRQGSTQSTQVVPTQAQTVFVPTTVPTPTVYEVSLIAPTDTGGMDEVPQATLNYSDQKQALRKKLPLQETGFKITFDYVSDHFIVTLSDPKTTSRQAFDNWLQQNYPLLPLSQFVLQ